MILKRTQFLELVQPQSGEKALAWKHPDNPKWWRHKWESTTKDLSALAGVMIREDKYGEGLYFFVNSAKSRSITSSDSNVRPSSGRKQENVAFGRSLFVDLDCKGEKPTEYKSKKEALATIYEHVSAKRLLKPTVINDSGTGLHMFWVGNQDLTGPEWIVKANGFKNYLLSLGLKFDETVTADAARVMRLPGSKHKKDPNNILDVNVLKYNPTAIYSWDHIPQAEAPASKYSGPTKRGRGTTARLSMARIAERCQIVGRELRTNGEGTSGTLWTNLALLAIDCEDGDALFHEMSAGHTEYDAGDTDEKLEQQRRKRASGDRQTLFTTAAVLDEASKLMDRPGCDGCPLATYCETPRDLGRDPSKYPPWPFFSYRRGLYHEREEDDGTKVQVQIANVNVTNVTWYDEPVPPHRPMLSYKINGNPMHMAVSGLPNQTASNVGKYLERHGVFANQGEAIAVGSLFVSWREQLQRTTPPVEPVEQIGWHAKRENVFVLAGREITKRGIVTTSPPLEGSPFIEYVPRGSQDVWQSIAAHVAEGSVQHQILLATGFAGPLLADANVPGFTMAFRSTASGVGKTTALQAAVGIWRNPNTYFGLNDTINAVHSVMGNTPGLTHYWDEVKFSDTTRKKQFTDFVHGVTLGRQKMRMTKDLEVHQQRSQHSFLVLTSNSTLSSLLASNQMSPGAFTARTLEIEMPAPINRERRPLFPLTDVESNYGWAGDVFLRAVVKNREKVQKLIMSNRDKIDKHLDMIDPGERRYHRNIAAAIATAAEIAAHLDLVPFNPVKVRVALITAIRNHFRTHASLVQSSLIGDWRTALQTALLANIDSWIVTTKSPKAVNSDAPMYLPVGNKPMAHVDVWSKRVQIPIRCLLPLFKSIKIAEPELMQQQIPPQFKILTPRAFAGGTPFRQRAAMVRLSFEELDFQDNVNAFLENAPTLGVGATHRIAS